MRGEHNIVGATSGGVAGSSPHARGARAARRANLHHAGIIPACAGSTISVRLIWRRSRDHPRMRGEHHCAVRDLHQGRGSSPHARGALLERLQRGGEDGIIPACAGSTSQRNPRGSCPWDHPRMRGEHSCSRSALVLTVGSSPHARGARGAWCRRWCRSGIIPACAGSTRSTRRPSPRRRDHPRMRGEHRAALSTWQVP